MIVPKKRKCAIRRCSKNGASAIFAILPSNSVADVMSHDVPYVSDTLTTAGRMRVSCTLFHPDVPRLLPPAGQGNRNVAGLASAGFHWCSALCGSTKLQGKRQNTASSFLVSTAVETSLKYQSVLVLLDPQTRVSAVMETMSTKSHFA